MIYYNYHLLYIWYSVLANTATTQINPPPAKTEVGVSANVGVYEPPYL